MSPSLAPFTQTSRLTPHTPLFLFTIGSFNTKPFLHKPSQPPLFSSPFENMASSCSPNPKGPSFSDFGITDSGELYGKNNPFQRSGPKGAVERIALKNDKLYMRVDMPGVPKQNMSCFLDHFNNVIFTGSAPKEWEHDDQVREFGGLYGLRCGCCEVAKLHGNITNGVLRMKMSKKILKNVTRCSYGPPPVDTPIIFLHEDIASHPYQTKGPRESYGAKEVKDGFYVWVDMPGVTKEKVSVGVENGWVLFSGKAGKESIHEESGRTYQGSFGPFDVNKIGKIKTEVKNGVLRMMIPEIGPE